MALDRMTGRGTRKKKEAGGRGHWRSSGAWSWTIRGALRGIIWRSVCSSFHISLAYVESRKCKPIIPFLDLRFLDFAYTRALHSTNFIAFLPSSNQLNLLSADTERTFLAWLRTSLAFASIGIAITQLFRLNTTISRREGLKPVDPSDNYRLRQLGKPLGATFLGIAILVLAIGGRRYFESQVRCSPLVRLQQPHVHSERLLGRGRLLYGEGNITGKSNDGRDE